MSTTGTRQEYRFGTKTVVLSRPDKVLFPDEGITKAQLVDYHLAAAPRMLPLLRDRPVSFVRYPDGIGGPSFFQQATPRYFPDWIERVRVAKDGGDIEHVLCRDEATLAYLAGQAVITVHAWLSRVDVPERLDRILFDLDPPGQGTDRFGEARAAAFRLRALLGELGLACVLATSGGRGLHVSVPISRRHETAEVREFSRLAATVLAAREPERLTTEFRKDQRRDRLYLDVSRNTYAQHAVAAYSVRARPGAPVATPLDWAELEDPAFTPKRFTLRTMPRRLEDADPWRRTPEPVGSLKEAWARLTDLAETDG